MKNNKYYLIVVILVSLISVLFYFISLDKKAYPENKKGTEKKVGNAISVETTKPDKSDITREIDAPGNIEALHTAELYAKVAGYIDLIKVDIGDEVKKGEVLAQLSIPEMAQEYQQKESELSSARADYREAKANYELQKTTYKRTMEIWQSEPRAIAKQDVDVAKAKFELAKAKKEKYLARIQNAKAALQRLKSLMDYSKIKAPFDGIVTKRFVDKGDFIQTATDSKDVTPVVEIMYIDTVRIFVNVPEKSVPMVQNGDKAVLVVDALENKQFHGTVTRFANSLDPDTRTMNTEIDIDNPGHILRPGMYGNVRLILDITKNALTIPAKALIVKGEKKFVYKVDNGIAKLVEIKTGIDNGTSIEVVNGLNGDEEIVTNGKSEVSDGDHVKISKS